MNAIFKRTSVREYADKPVEDEKLELLLRAGMAAPSAGNQQPWEFYVVKDKALLNALAACSPYAGCVRNAAVAIVPCSRTTGLRHAAYAQIDMSASTENILLEAQALGLGAVWLGIAPLQERMDAVGKLLHVPENLAPFAILSIGYPAKTADRKDRFDTARIHTVG